MGRRPAYRPLAVFLNGRRVGTLTREASGAIQFAYHADWLGWAPAMAVSLSMPLREMPYRGAVVSAVFENLLPDSEALRRQVAERVGARGIGAFDLLSRIGRDCIGALQFLPEGEVPGVPGAIEGETVDGAAIERILNGLARAPLGLRGDDDFRISVAGAQEKTALLRHDGQWKRPFGTTPTTHLLKTRVGQLPGGIDLTDSVENEFYCLKLVEAFGLPVNVAWMETFGETQALVIERFDRLWARDGRLLRVPQEDLCQSLSVPPTLKYQGDGGPGAVDVLRVLEGSDRPTEDRERFLKTLVIFWLIGAPDGHAKNYSLFLRPGGGYAATPVYDVLSGQPALDAGQVRHGQFRMAMSLGDRRHYRFDAVTGRHFVQTAVAGGLSAERARALVEAVAEAVPEALEGARAVLPAGFPEALVASVEAGVRARLGRLTIAAP
ncbi:type II toxin-antitoxin system HipA family toxin [Sagittula sp. S175]|uniref:type II toxin-antitoxin system HipA family toxin n=1 Tax=Sagittula sp. S175 TaxID=3415129 RepID=UPI003C7E7605